MSLQERLLHQVGRIEQAPKPRVDLESRQQFQVRLVSLQFWTGRGIVAG
jgi:hypothetical protein